MRDRMADWARACSSVLPWGLTKPKMPHKPLNYIRMRALSPSVVPDLPRRNDIEIAVAGDTPDEIQLLPVARQRRVILVGGRVDRRAERRRGRPLAVDEPAHIEIAEARAAGPQ